MCYQNHWAPNRRTGPTQAPAQRKHPGAQAVVGPAAVEHMAVLDGIAQHLATRLRAPLPALPARIDGAPPWCHATPP